MEIKELIDVKYKKDSKLSFIKNLNILATLILLFIIVA